MVDGCCPTSCCWIGWVGSSFTLVLYLVSFVGGVNVNCAPAERLMLLDAYALPLRYAQQHYTMLFFVGVGAVGGLNSECV